MIFYSVVKYGYCIDLSGLEKTVNHLIFASSLFGNFKRLTYQHRLILVVSFKLFSILIGTTFKGENMLPMGRVFLHVETFCSKLVFDVPSTIFQLNRDGASWVETVLS